jgi:indolepyruvate ferredoxin oxidoreductase
MDLPAVEKAAARASSAETRTIPETLDEIIAHRMGHLTRYQNAAYAARYRALVDKVIAAERAAMPGSQALAIAVAKYYAKLLAYKDEYEVARLHSDPVFRERIAAQFEGDYKVHFHLAPPAVSHADPVTGRIKKKQFGPWMMAVFSALARLKGLRGTTLDPFARSEDRKLERRLVAEYEALIAEVVNGLSPENHVAAVALAALPEQIRGYGHIKEASVAAGRKRQEELLAAFRSPSSTRRAAE